MSKHHHREPEGADASQKSCCASAPAPKPVASCCSHKQHGHHGHEHARPASDVPMPGGTIYTCPMHPEIRQVGPGNCPKCGMALEPELPSEHVDDSELHAVQRKFWISLALTVPVVIIAMAPHMLGLGISHSTAGLLRTIEMLLSVPVVLWAAADYYKRGWL